MTRDDIIRVARQVGYPLVEYEGEPYVPPLLAALLGAAAADEREACAKLCEDAAKQFGLEAPCAAAIRARGQA